MLKFVVAAICITVAPVAAQDQSLDDLFAALRTAEGETVRVIEGKIVQEWSKSGSPAADLLLDRGRRAMESEDWALAIDHLSALVDHAPDFAEGWNARATAYYQAGRFGQSLEDIRTTLALNPRHFGALSGLAIIMEQLGRKEDALRAWRAVQDISPNRPDLQGTVERLERETLGRTL